MSDIKIFGKLKRAEFTFLRLQKKKIFRLSTRLIFFFQNAPVKQLVEVGHINNNREI
jgi:hypothetical protein